MVKPAKNEKHIHFNHVPGIMVHVLLLAVHTDKWNIAIGSILINSYVAVIIIFGQFHTGQGTIQPYH